MLWKFVVLCVFLTSSAKEVFDNLDYIIACHSTDFECFKRQYRSLRDNVLLGSDVLGIEQYQPTVLSFRLTCVRVSGVEESELVAISFDSSRKELKVVWELPMRLQEVNHSDKCGEVTNRKLLKFSANATIVVTYPYTLKTKKGKTYLDLSQEDLDMILDVPDYTPLKNRTRHEMAMFESSEWAYQVVQSFDGAEEIALPYSERFRVFASRIPLEKYLLLYPEERYNELEFSFSDTWFRREGFTEDS